MCFCLRGKFPCLVKYDPLQFKFAAKKELQHTSPTPTPFYSISFSLLVVELSLCHLTLILNHTQEKTSQSLQNQIVLWNLFPTTDQWRFFPSSIQLFSKPYQMRVFRDRCLSRDLVLSPYCSLVGWWRDPELELLIPSILSMPCQFKFNDQLRKD
jgi:hypothetical protein